jgi:hypothetical protein
MTALLFTTAVKGEKYTHKIHTHLRSSTGLKKKNIHTPEILYRLGDSSRRILVCQFSLVQTIV